MLSKNKIKLIRSLQQKKCRKLNNLFVIEGEKMITECLRTDMSMKMLILTFPFHERIEKRWLDKIEECIVVNETELKRVSSLSTASMGVAVVQMPNVFADHTEVVNSLSLVLDTIQDPGNLGTIIRVADWYGIRNIFCSYDAADIYNPKVLQASMGSFLRVKVHYCDLPELLTRYKGKEKFEMYGTFLDGANLYDEPLNQQGFIVIGNESRGISESLAGMISKRLFIPGYPAGKESAESLNASIATALICAEFRRRFKS